MIRLLHTDPTNKNIVFLAKCELDIRLDRIKLSGQHVNQSHMKSDIRLYQHENL